MYSILTSIATHFTAQFDILHTIFQYSFIYDLILIYYNDLLRYK